MTERLQNKVRHSKKTLTEVLNDISVVTGREVVQRIKDKENLRKQFEEAVEFEVRNSRIGNDQTMSKLTSNLRTAYWHNCAMDINSPTATASA